MAIIIESVLSSPQESLFKINRAANHDDIVKKKLLVGNKTCSGTRGFGKNESTWHMNFQHYHGADKMWSIMNPMSHHHAHMGPLTTQKREYSLSVNKVPIVPGKTFCNPNFVIIKNPPVHTLVSTPLEDIHSEKLSTNTALIDSSQSLVDTIRQHHFDTVKTPEVGTNKPIKMCTKRRRKARRKKPGKNSKQSNARNEIKDMMEVEVTDVETSFSFSDIYEAPILTTTFNLTDFIVKKPCMPLNTTVESESESDEEFTTVISVSPPSIKIPFIKQRQLSVSSEDSFIMFDKGTDEESSSSEGEYESETDDEWDEEDESEDQDDGKDEVDFIRPSCPVVVPSKKVTFADDADLCEVHNMIKWSFAYQQARKGHWEEYARDRDRFSRRVCDAERILTPVLDVTHRDKVYRQRFQNENFTN